MIKNILLIGQCSLHLGRLEYGNIGNYYIIEPLIKNIQKTFPKAKIKTTFQLTDTFCKKNGVIRLPLDLYYSWENTYLEKAQNELIIAEKYYTTGKLIKITPYINEVIKSDLVIDFSGDMWGDNADLAGKDRFLIGLIKDRVAQYLRKKTVLLAGSPGPFVKNKSIIKFAKEVYNNFDLVTNREPLSTTLLKKQGFDVSKTKNTACPSVLFDNKNKVKKTLIKKIKKLNSTKLIKIGFILSGWNFTKGPFNKENRSDDEYQPFIDFLEHILLNYKAYIFLMSHSNGFKIISNRIVLTHGRDYFIIKKVEEIIKKRKIVKNIYSLNDIYDPWTTKAIISQFDLLISGRIHGAIAGLSQNVPTLIIDYGHEPKAHKLKGFAKLFNVEKYLADPSKKNELLIKFNKLWKDKKIIKKNLENKINKIKKLALDNFQYLKNL